MIKLPDESIATSGDCWLSAVVVLTRKSFPDAIPFLSNCLAYTPSPLPSMLLVCHVNINAPLLLIAPLGFPIEDRVEVLTTKSERAVVPLALYALA